jgi:hypothetical protein
MIRVRNIYGNITIKDLKERCEGNSWSIPVSNSPLLGLNTALLKYLQYKITFCLFICTMDP